MVRKAIGIISGAFVLLGVVLLAREPALEKAAWGMALVAGGEVLLVGAYIALALRQAPLSIWRSDFPSYREAARIAREKQRKLKILPLEDYAYFFCVALAALVGGTIFLSRLEGAATSLSTLGIAFIAAHLFIAVPLGFVLGTAPYVKWFSPVPEARSQAERLLLEKPRVLQWGASMVAVFFFIILIGSFSWGETIVAHFFFHPNPITESHWNATKMFHTAEGCFVVVPDKKPQAKDPENIAENFLEAGGKALSAIDKRHYPPGSTLWCVNTPANQLIGILLGRLPELERLPLRVYP